MESMKDTSKGEITEGFLGADLKAVCTEAGMFAIRSERKKLYQKTSLMQSTKFYEKVG